MPTPKQIEIIRLVHPVFGVMGERVKNGKYTKKIIIQTFKFTYGKKFYDCSIEITKENTNPKWWEYFGIKKPNSKSQVGADADSSTKDEDLFVCQHNAKPNVCM